MKYYVNENCIGCGMCNAICPSVFEMTEDGVAKAVDSEIPEADFTEAENARNGCPFEAIEQK